MILIIIIIIRMLKLNSRFVLFLLLTIFISLEQNKQFCQDDWAKTN